MPIPSNRTPMHGGHRPFGYIDMGGMFTVLGPADPAQLRADGISGDGRP